MSIDNISKICSRKKQIYLFDVPSIDDEEELTSFLLIDSKEGFKIEKITDFEQFVDEIRRYNVKEIRRNTKEYFEFIYLLRILLERYVYVIDKHADKISLTLRDLSNISKNYKQEIIRTKMEYDEKNRR